MTHANDPTLQAESMNLRIGYIPLHFYFPYWASLAQGIKARAAERGVKLCVPTSNPDEDLEAAINEVVQQRPAVAILSDNVTDHLPHAPRIFAAAGIPTIGAATEANPQYVGVVHADEAQGTALVVKHLFEYLHGSGSVAHIAIPRNTHRRAEFHRMLQRYPQITLAYEADGHWTRETGAQVMRAALEAAPDLRGVFADNDLMAVGAADVVATHGLGAQINIVGFDADPEGLIAIREGSMLATVYRGQYGLGRAVLDSAVAVAQGHTLPAETRIPTKLITAANLVDATIDTTYMLSTLLHDLVESNRTQRQLQQQTIAAQRSMIEELSTPIIPISDGVLIMPLIGSIDNARAQQIMETILQAISTHNAHYFIIDITGIAIVDTAIIQHLMQAAQAVQLLGTQMLLVGVNPDVAQSIVGLGGHLKGIRTFATLQAGFLYAQRQVGRRAYKTV